ncbi:uncharacterized protein [Miscanthus floridulus]|uniref:uncharacterized protein n=1 Tax=Miscanthus floridulus TaxID=154761 RepID=UPI0034582B7E
MPLQWFDKLKPRSIRYWDDLQTAFCNNFAGIITHPMMASKLKGVRQRRGESLRDYYRRFGEFRAQAHDITDREVIEAFAEGIFANWQFKDYYSENPRTNEDFKRIVEKLILSEERTRHRFARDNPENRGKLDQRQQDKRSRQDDMVATTDNKRRYNNNNYNSSYNNGSSNNYRNNNYRERRPESLENLPCHIHLGSGHKLVDCFTFQQQFVKRENGHQNNAEKKQDEPKKEEKKAQGDYQEPQHQLAVIFSGAPNVRSKQQEKLEHRAIMAAELATPRYLNWSEYPIQFTREDQWTSMANAGCYPLVLGPTIVGVAVTKVLIDGGAGLNIIFTDTLKKMSLDCEGLMTPTSTPFYGIVPGKEAMPHGQITLPVTFRTAEKYHTEFIKFEVADFESCYHAILGRPALTKYMAIPHYRYLLLKMPMTKGVLSLRGDLKKAYDYDVQAVQISERLQDLKIGKEIATLATEMNPDEIQIPAKKPSNFAPPKEAATKTIDLLTGDLEKTAIISANLDPK